MNRILLRQAPKNLATTAAALSLAAGLIHMGATNEHLNEWWGYGVFFIMAALTQVVYALIAFVRPWRYDETGGMSTTPERYERPFYLAGIVGNGLIVLLYLVTRTVGIPFFGPDAGQVEPLTVLSVAATLAEIALIWCLVNLLEAPTAQPA